MTSARFDLAIAEACRIAQVPFEEFVSTVMAGGYPCLPGVAPGSRAASTKPTCSRSIVTSMKQT
ncbi:hypothetical protein E3H11_27745 [Bradyrhizobium brasilense]|uniref:hypothetical protein n=1 Tax=Bradyrhizobium brasilense TaxID=1419277 RepID=UPI0014577D58|nr:hypothetical protein [Bradyrhizobium brasilense]NLS72628.1 hypothetical protein [Bradyrhizobium brasilense]